MDARFPTAIGLLCLAGCATAPRPVAPMPREMLEERVAEAPPEPAAAAPPVAHAAPREATAGTARHALAAAPGRPNFDTISYGALADRWLMPEFSGRPEWYCGCDFDPGTKAVDWDSCGFVPITPGDHTRGAKIEWEHVVPRSWSATAAGCDTATGCSGPEYNRMITDPYALVPAVGALNGKRSNHVYWEVAGEDHPYGQCDFEVGFEDGRTYIEPPDHMKGDLARITLYMVRRYDIEVPEPGALTLYRRWARQDPVSQRERAWMRAIRAKVADWKYPYDR